MKRLNFVGLGAIKSDSRSKHLAVSLYFCMALCCNHRSEYYPKRQSESKI